ncbi:HAD family hydrolase [Limisalsivibrio acetivorans]|uniref:HAD family hydrolase n=1 Tax=Limisalsivibrio acetivorans TaxID=1304888 RepID=UPI0003B40506|nr:HAD family hydrolase [Limisalsivibrio acetivorans]
MNKTLVLFDFDGTLTNTDSLLDFAKYYKGRWLFYLFMTALSPLLIMYKTKLISGHRMKEIFLSLFFAGEIYDKFQNKACNYSRYIIPTILREDTTKILNQHRENGDRIIVVSASLNDYLHIWCKEQGLELLSTKIEVTQGKLTGKIKGHNCNGFEKAKRIKELLKLEDYTDIYAYGNGSGDLEMLELANFKFMVKREGGIVSL